MEDGKAYDFIVIGTGSAGCVPDKRLSAAPPPLPEIAPVEGYEPLEAAVA